jgi:RNA polymerase sigma factor (TIGR02999 family)
MEPDDAMTKSDDAALGLDSTAQSPSGNSVSAGIDLHQLDDDSVCVLYRQLRTAAAMLRSNAFHSDSIRSTELVHEAFAKMLGQQDAVFDSERHLLNTASLVMKSLLIDRLRRRKLRAGATAEIARLQLVRDAHAVPGRPDAVVEFHEHLQLLEQRRPLAAEVFRYRFFFEMTQREIASIVARSVPTVHREIAFARAFLARQMG